MRIDEWAGMQRLVPLALLMLAACVPLQSGPPTGGWSQAEAQCARWVDGRFYCTSAPERRFVTPAPLQVPLSLTTFSGSTWAACGMDAAGNAYCWRWDQSFENEREVLTLGVDSLSGRTGLRAASVASSGHDWACGTDASGLAWCAALLPEHQHSCLQKAGDSLCRRQPVRVTGAVRFSVVDVGEAPHGSYGFACGLSLDGQAYCWHRDGVFLFTDGGDPELCRIPRLKLFNCTREPRPVHTPARFTGISVGMGYACGITTGSEVQCWGYSGPLEVLAAFRDCDYQSDFICTAVPSRVVDLPPAISVSAGDIHACAVTTDRRAVCWGNGSMGQLGDRSEASGSFGDRTLVAVRGDHRWSEVTAGPFLSCGITTRSEWYCWGQQPIDNPQFPGPQQIPPPFASPGG